MLMSWFCNVVWWILIPSFTYSSLKGIFKSSKNSGSSLSSRYCKSRFIRFVRPPSALISLTRVLPKSRFVRLVRPPSALISSTLDALKSRFVRFVRPPSALISLTRVHPKSRFIIPLSKLMQLGSLPSIIINRFHRTDSQCLIFSKISREKISPLSMRQSTS